MVCVCEFVTFDTGGQRAPTDHSSLNG